MCSYPALEGRAKVRSPLRGESSIDLVSDTLRQSQAAGTSKAMSKDRKTSRIAIALVALWVVFTVTLAGWWLIFGLRQLDLINQSNLENASQIRRHYQMLT